MAAKTLFSPLLITLFLQQALCGWVDSLFLCWQGQLSVYLLLNLSIHLLLDFFRVVETDL